LVARDVNALMEAAASQIVALAAEAIAEHGRFAWALSGGSTPKQLYGLLAQPRFASQIDWTRVHFFWGDERCVPPDHVDSNFRMVREALLDAIRPRSEQVHRMRGEIDPEEAARAYAEELSRFFGVAVAGPPPRFDLILLGLGGDGHTASLFPGTPALHENQRWVVVNQKAEGEPLRLTFTLPLINAAAHVRFLVSGASKAVRIEQILDDVPAAGSDVLPAQLVRPVRADLQWLLDEDAASLLERAR
jgi:6-phosphogluconolactonase